MSHWDTRTLKTLRRTGDGDGSPQSDGPIKNTDRSKIIHDHRMCVDRPDPIVCMSLVIVHEESCEVSLVPIKPTGPLRLDK